MTSLSCEDLTGCRETCEYYVFCLQIGVGLAGFIVPVDKGVGSVGGVG